MSLLKKLEKGVKRIAKKALPLAAVAAPIIAPGIGGIGGKVLSTIGKVSTSTRVARTPAGAPPGTFRSAQDIGIVAPAPVSARPVLSLPPVGRGTQMSMLPALGGIVRAIPGVGRAVGAVGAGALVAGRSAAAVSRAAATWCRKNPAWCAQVGGVAAIAGMVQRGELPMPPRRRRRGITPKDLQSFRRVANLIRGYCPTVRRIPRKARR